MARSEERTDFFGNVSTVHYNDGGEKIGESREEKTFLGDTYVVHTDSQGNKVGESHEEKTFLGDTYTVHTDAHGSNIGKSSEEKTFFGDQRTMHTDVHGTNIGQSQNERDWTGEHYTNHTGTVPYMHFSPVDSQLEHNNALSMVDYSDSGGNYSGTDSPSNGSKSNNEISDANVIWIVLAGLALAVIAMSNSNSVFRSPDQSINFQAPQTSTPVPRLSLPYQAAPIHQYALSHNGVPLNVHVNGAPSIVWSDGYVEVWADNGSRPYVLNPGSRLEFRNSYTIHAVPRNAGATLLYVEWKNQ